MNSELQALRQQIQQLDELLESGALSPETHRNSRGELEQKLVALVLAQPAAAEPPAALSALVIPSNRAKRGVWLGVGAFVLLVGGAGYWWTGSPAGWSSSSGTPGAVSSANARAESAGPLDMQAPHEMGQDQMAATVQALADRLKAQPNDGEGWAMLARSYATLGRHADSLPAYVKALALLKNDAVVMADYADALALQQGRRLSGEPMVWIARALLIEPGQPKALLLAGTAAFDRKDYAQAIVHWSRVVQGGPPENALVKQAQSGLEDARRLSGQPPISLPATTTPATTAPTTSALAKTASAQTVSAGAGISGLVSLDPKLAAKVKPDDAVFIYARPAQGSRMPLAMLRRQVADLPLYFELDDSMAMSPQARLSSVKEVVVAVRVSKSGQATPQSGDLEGFSGTVSAGSKDLKLKIDRILP